MAKAKINFQKSFGANPIAVGENFTVTSLTCNGTSSYFVLPNSTKDVKILGSSKTASGAILGSAVKFYLTGRTDTIVNIEGQDTNSFVFVSRVNDLGYAPEGGV